MKLLRVFHQPRHESFSRPPAYTAGRLWPHRRADTPSGQERCFTNQGKTAIRAEFATDFLLAAEWVVALLYPLDGLREWVRLFLSPARPKLESIPVLAAALLDDHASCLALLTTAPTEPLLATQRAELQYRHQCMAWMLRTYLA